MTASNERRTPHQARHELLDLIGHGIGGTAGADKVSGLLAEIELLTRRDERRQLAAVLRLRRASGRHLLLAEAIDALIRDLTADEPDLADGDHFAGMPTDGVPI